MDSQRPKKRPRLIVDANTDGYFDTYDHAGHGCGSQPLETTWFLPAALPGAVSQEFPQMQGTSLFLPAPGVPEISLHWTWDEQPESYQNDIVDFQNNAIEACIEPEIVCFGMVSDVSFPTSGLGCLLNPEPPRLSTSAAFLTVQAFYRNPLNSQFL
jgi:hypothetical protein